MRTQLPEKLEDGRLTTGLAATCRDDGPYGIFRIQGPCGERLTIVASGTADPASHGWEHVSVSTTRRPPNWTEMCFVKDLFWDAEETVFQLHPPRSQWISNHPHCLHLWRNVNQPVPMPPAHFVGLKSEGTMSPQRANELFRRQLMGEKIY